jgi:hypothetical protein
MITMIADHQPRRGIEHQLCLGHVIERGVESRILDPQLLLSLTQCRRSLFDQPLEAAIEAIQLFDHQGDRPIGAPAVVVSLIVGAGNQLTEQVGVNIPTGLSGLCKLSGKQAVHETSSRSPHQARRDRPGCARRSVVASHATAPFA